MKIFSQKQLPLWDQHTRVEFDTESLSLSEEAGYNISEALVHHQNIVEETEIHIYCGSGLHRAYSMEFGLYLVEFKRVDFFNKPNLT